MFIVSLAFVSFWILLLLLASSWITIHFPTPYSRSIFSFFYLRKNKRRINRHHDHVPWIIKIYNKKKVRNKSTSFFSTCQRFFLFYPYYYFQYDTPNILLFFIYSAINCKKNISSLFLGWCSWALVLSIKFSLFSCYSLCSERIQSILFLRINKEKRRKIVSADNNEGRL